MSEAAAEGIVEKKYESVVDKVFDAAIAGTAKALVGVKNGLEASARWLEGRAKVFGELAGKLTA